MAVVDGNAHEVRGRSSRDQGVALTGGIRAKLIGLGGKLTVNFRLDL